MDSGEPEVHRLEVADAVHVHRTDEVNLTQYASPDNLAVLGRRLIDAGDFSTATIVLHTACELATERCISSGLSKLRVPQLDGPISALTRSRSFLNDDLRELFNAATGGEIHKQPFWSSLLESTRRRNRVVHVGLVVVSSDAESSYSAVTGAIAYMQGLGSSESA